MLRMLVSRRWLARHAVLLLAVAACLLLGRWQWRRGEAHGSGQNFVYAVQWCLFACAAVFGWVRLIRDDFAPPAVQQAEQSGGGAAGDDGLPGGLRLRQTVPPADEEPDDELAAYNRYLAELNARDQRQLR